MRKYDEYKDSGVSWIGKIPKHWEARYLFQLASEYYVPNKGMLNQNLLSLSYGSIVRKDINKTEGLLPASFETYQIVEPNIIVLRLTDLQNDHKSLRVGIAKEKGIITSAYLSLNVRKGNNPDYVYYLLHANDIHKVFYSMGGGLRQSLNYDGLKYLRILAPPVEEQNHIVNYLSTKNNEINTLISKTEREIELLKELKQSVVAHAVTKGLNPNAKMKDSGIGWIGEIPEHWEVKQLRNYLTFTSKKGYPDETLLSVVREQGVIVRDIESQEQNHNFIPDDLSDYKLVRKGQFVINKMKSWQGSYGVSAYDGIVSPAYYVCDLKFALKSFFNEAIRSKVYVPFFTQYSKGIRVGQWDLSPIGLKSIPFIEPPHSEQQEIVEYIDYKTTQIDKMIVELTYKVEYLKQYKQRLIADVVTGKINVQPE